MTMPGSRTPWPARLGRALRVTVQFTAVVLLVFVLVEGLANTALFAFYMIRHAQPFEERRHADHDPEIGWVNRPRVRIDDMYGDGVFLRTNRRGFRGEAEVDSVVPAGQRRLICSGDSFTLGYGVDDDHTWCAQLGVLDTTWQPVNMGQGGYGIDQAYLWYRRDGVRIDHQLQVFAFITDDYNRMRRKHFGGYQKPILVRDGDSLVVGNLPVPRVGFFRTWMARAAPDIANLGSVRVLGKVLGRLMPNVQVGVADADLSNAQVREAAFLVFDDLAAIHASRGSRLALVHLPVGQDHSETVSDLWRSQLRLHADSVGLTFVDLVEDFRELPAADAAAMFLPWSSPGKYHYTAAGNRWVAERLHDHLTRAVPELFGHDR